ncbi:nicotinamide-nucleotide amidohydrolase family protein, partial [bacterium]
GPTHDDITKQALVELFNAKLIFLKSRHQEIIKKFNKVKLPKCQSEILDISKPLENKIGTALGMYFKYNGTNIIIMPGVPIEMKSMLDLYLNEIKSLKTSNNNVITINTSGIYETKLSDMIKDFIIKYENYIYFSFLPSYEGVKIRLTDLGVGGNINKIKDELLHLLDKYAYGLNNNTLEMTISNILIKKKNSLSICESCTGGFISKRFTDIPGSSNFFLGSIIAYDNSIKNAILDIPIKYLDKYGAVSHQVSELMALNISKKFNSDISISCTGISGPGGGTKEKPVGTVFITIKFFNKIVTKDFIFKVDRNSHRLMTKQAALFMLWTLIK